MIIYFSLNHINLFFIDLNLTRSLNTIFDYKIEDFFSSTKSLSNNEIEENSSFHIIGDSITFLSGDFTENIKVKTTRIVPKITRITFLSDILFIK